MKKFKKTLAMFLSVALIIAAVFSMGISAGAAVQSDAKDSKHLEAIETLGALGIMIGDDQGMFRPTEAITRAEAAKVAVYALGLEDIAASYVSSPSFSDVADDHWARGYINVATGQGLLKGDDGIHYRPNDTVTYAEAMTILVRTIGREPEALSKGAYPAGYLVVAADNGLTRNAPGRATDPANRELVAQMTFNALTAKMMERLGFGEKEEFVITDKTLLKDKLGVDKVLGQVTATSQSKLNGTGFIQKGQVQIGEDIFKLNGSNAANLLGFNVAAYVRENDRTEEKEIILIRADESKNAELAIAADNFHSIVDAAGKMVISYWKDKENDTRETKVDVNSDALLIYNGKAETMDKALVNMKDKAGSVRLLDVDRDGKYDVVFVVEYNNIVVEEVVASTGKINNKYGAAPITLDPEDDRLEYSIVKGGTMINVADLKEWDVVSVAKSLDGMVYNMVVSNETVEGRVTEIDPEGKVTIGGESYSVANSYTAGVQLEDEGVFYLDAEGKIAAVNAVGRISSNYAYLMNASKDNSFDESLELRVFTKTGETVTLKATDRIRFNGQNNRRADDVLAALKNGGSAIEKQLITFEKNADGKVTTINTAVNSASHSKDVFAKNATLTGAIYKSATGKVGTINVDANTIIFDIPSGAAHSDDYAIRNRSMFENDTPYDVVVFDMTEDFTARAMIVTSTDYKASAESDIAIVTSLGEVKNSNDNIVDKLYAMQDGKAISLLSVDSDVLEKAAGVKLEKGDIIQYKTNSNGEITTVRVLFDASAKGTQFEATPETDLNIMYGQVMQKFATSMNMTVDGGAVRNISFANAKVYRVDTSKNANAITTVTTGDIQKYDTSDASYVFVKTYKDIVTEIVIIKL